MKNNILAIGIDDYKFVNKLNNCVKDIDNILDILVEKFDFEKENISRLFNSDANQNKIIDSFEDLLYRQNNGENLIIFYSGHGDFDSNLDLGYFLPFETELDKKHTYIPNTTLFNYLKSFEYRHNLIISDSCFSGSLFENSRFTRDLPEKLYEIPSKWALTSGRIEKVSDGIPGENSPFASSILKNLKEFKGNSLSISELTNLVISDVANLNSQLPRGSELSKYGDKGGQFSFKVKNKTIINYNFKNDNDLDNYKNFINEYYSFFEKYEESENNNNKATSRRLLEELNFIKTAVFREIIKEIELNKNYISKQELLKDVISPEFIIKYKEVQKANELKNNSVKKRDYESAAKHRDLELEETANLLKIFIDFKSKFIDNVFKNEDKLIEDFSVVLILLELFITKKQEQRVGEIKKQFIELYFLKKSKEANKVTEFRFKHNKESFFNFIISIIDNNFIEIEEENNEEDLASEIKRKYGIEPAAANPNLRTGFIKSQRRRK